MKLYQRLSRQYTVRLYYCLDGLIHILLLKWFMLKKFPLKEVRHTFHVLYYAIEFIHERFIIADRAAVGGFGGATVSATAATTCSTRSSILTAAGRDDKKRDI